MTNKYYKPERKKLKGKTKYNVILYILSRGSISKVCYLYERIYIHLVFVLVEIYHN